MHRGAYHFYESNDNPQIQANHFIQTVNKLETGDLPPVLDLEGGGIKGEVNIDSLHRDVLIWLNIVEKHFGIKPIIYSNNPYANKYLMNDEFANYEIWLAEYGVKEPRIPHTWSKKGILIWQKTEKGKIEGAIGNIDHDLFIGDKSQYEALVK